MHNRQAELGVHHVPYPPATYLEGPKNCRILWWQQGRIVVDSVQAEWLGAVEVDDFGVWQGVELLEDFAVGGERRVFPLHLVIVGCAGLPRECNGIRVGILNLHQETKEQLRYPFNSAAPTLRNASGLDNKQFSHIEQLHAALTHCTRCNCLNMMNQLDQTRQLVQ